jgi:hypothetical protein
MRPVMPMALLRGRAEQVVVCVKVGQFNQPDDIAWSVNRL